MKFKPGDKCRIKKIMGGNGCKPHPKFRVGSLVIVESYDAYDNPKWPYCVHGMGPNTCYDGSFKTAELELVKRKGAQC